MSKFTDSHNIVIIRPVFKGAPTKCPLFAATPEYLNSYNCNDRVTLISKNDDLMSLMCDLAEKFDHDEMVAKRQTGGDMFTAPQWEVIDYYNSDTTPLNSTAKERLLIGGVK